MRKPIFPKTRTASALLMPGSLGISDRDDGFLDAFQSAFLGLDFEPLLNRDLDILHGLFTSRTLRMAAGQRGTTHRPPFIGLHQLDVVLHGLFCSHNSNSARAR